MHTKMSLYTHLFPKSVCIETFLCALHTSFFTVYSYMFALFDESVVDFFNTAETL